jgi:hypothetical protein
MISISWLQNFAVDELDLSDPRVFRVKNVCAAVLNQPTDIIRFVFFLTFFATPIDFLSKMGYYDNVRLSVPA